MPGLDHEAMRQALGNRSHRARSLRALVYTMDERLKEGAPIMTSIESVLKVYGNGIEADDFADQLGHLMRRRVTVDPRALSDHDRGVLAAVGVPAADLDRQQSGGIHGGW